MKKFIFLSVVLLSSFALRAQSYSENTIQIFAATLSSHGTEFSKKYGDEGRQNLAFGFGWRARISEKLEFDITGAYEEGLTGTRTESLSADGYPLQNYSFKERFHSYSFLAGLHNNWYEGLSTNLYSSVNLGIIHTRNLSTNSLPVDVEKISDIDGTRFAYHITALGLQLNLSESVGLFAEVGYGALGIAKGGLSIRF